MKVSEIFLSLQGEGAYNGEPAIFVRTFGCNKNCDFCDTKYASMEYTEFTNEEVSKKIITLVEQYYKDKTGESPAYDLLIIFTGGEPTLWIFEIIEITKLVNKYFGYSLQYHIETNGTYLNPILFGLFDFITFSPKTKKDAEDLWAFLDKYEKITATFFKYEIKIVTDGNELNKNLIIYADTLLPLTTFNEEKDREIKEKVWNMSILFGKKYSPRLHVDIFGNKRGV